MKCPLFGLARNTDGDPFPTTTQDCLKEECAWWAEEMKQCDPTGLLPQLYQIEGHLAELVEKMPHLEQFKRP